MHLLGRDGEAAVGGARCRGRHPAANRDFQLYLDVRSRFEAISLAKTVIHTDEPLEECVAQALAALR